MPVALLVITVIIAAGITVAVAASTGTISLLAPAALIIAAAVLVLRQ